MPKTLFCALGSVNWDDVRSPATNLAEFANENLYHARAVAASLPGSRLHSHTSPPPMDPATDAHAAALPQHPRLSSHVLLYAERLQSEWTPVKVSAENGLGVRVFKMAASKETGGGSWFGRISVHREFPFERWRSAFHAEFGEGVRNGVVVRGMGAVEVLERERAGLSQMAVYRMAAKFPGPTAPRDFISMVLTAESRAPSSSTDAQACPLREFIIVSKPCTHPRGPPVTGTIRGTYESVELVREVLVNDDDFGDGVAVEWTMVTRSDPGGNVPRFMVERGTPGGICADAEKFFRWMRTTDLSEYEAVGYNETEVEHCDADEKSECGSKTGSALMARVSTNSTHKSMSPLPQTAQPTKPTGNSPADLDSDSDSNSDISFFSARSVLRPTPSPPPAIPRLHIPRCPPATKPPGPGHLARHSHYTYPITYTDSATAPPRLSSDWMSSTEEIAACIVSQQEQHPRHRSRTGLAGYEERSLHLPSHNRGHDHRYHRHPNNSSSNDSNNSNDNISDISGILLHKHHRSLADKLLGRHPPNTYTKAEEQQLKTLAKTQRLATKNQRRAEKLLEKQDKAVQKRVDKERRAAEKLDRRRRDSSATASTSTAREDVNYNAVVGLPPDMKTEVPRSAEVSRKAEMDVLKQQLVQLQDQNALLAGRLSQMGLESNEICDVAAVSQTARNMRR
ncbi:hypothetical protein TD95_004903 [Thielaviopsis punctulata]|uniref:START domain-containing protein n=1 Tax=Thielaviopsis punctulata TaxID=72032 RepID=A0A0F4ZIT8_9PEZI|nr:hypothetical protein TD95_004903 [Thielaviopsis punctulata]